MPLPTVEQFIAALKPGRANGQSVHELAFLLGCDDRQLRRLQVAAVAAGTPVCAHPTTGYYIGQCWEEVEGVYHYLHQRGLHSLTKAANLRRAFTGVVTPNATLPLETPHAN